MRPVPTVTSEPWDANWYAPADMRRFPTSTGSGAALQPAVRFTAEMALRAENRRATTWAKGRHASRDMTKDREQRSYTRPCENVGNGRNDVSWQGSKAFCFDVHVKFAPNDVPEGLWTLRSVIAVISNNKRAAIASISAGTPRIAITRLML